MASETSSFVDWIKLTPRYLFALLLTASLIIFLPESLVQKIGLRETWSNPRFWVGLVFVLVSSLLITHGIVEVYSFGHRKYIAKRNGRRRFEYLKHLSPSEKKLLRSYIDNRTKTRNLPYDEGTVTGLIREGILYYASNRATNNLWNRVGEYCTDINMEQWAWQYIMQHPEVTLDVHDKATDSQT